MSKGAFILDEIDDDFDLKPSGIPIPDDQQAICRDVYALRNILMLLKYHTSSLRRQRIADAAADEEIKEFMMRVKQAAKAGCVGESVNTKSAEAALEDIRNDVLRRKGRPLVYRYLTILGLYALGGLCLGTLICLFLPVARGYGAVFACAMVGAWISTAAGRRDVSFSGIQDYVDRGYEPLIRILFAGLLAAALALLLQVGILTIKVGSIDFSEFQTKTIIALCLGLISGFGEKALSLKVLDSARNLLPK